jgi:hypothetical protein
MQGGNVSEFVADLAPKWACLPKLQVMGIGRTAAADKKRLRAHEVPMRFIALLYRLLRARPRFHRTFEPSELTMFANGRPVSNLEPISPACPSNLSA